MKTTAQKLVVIAAVALFTLTIDAQNVKSVKAGFFNEEFTEMVTNKIEPVVSELTAQLENLEAFVRFTPKEIRENFEVAESSSNFDYVLDELKDDLKYSPAEVSESLSESSDNMEPLDNALVELESVVKFNPSETVTNNSGSEFEEILNELSSVAKYAPAVAI